MRQQPDDINNNNTSIGNIDHCHELCAFNIIAPNLPCLNKLLVIETINDLINQK